MTLITLKGRCRQLGDSKGYYLKTSLWLKVLPTCWKAFPPRQSTLEPVSGFPHCSEIISSTYTTRSLPANQLSGKSSSQPCKTQIPEMGLLLLAPKRLTLAKAFFFSLSNYWNIPVDEVATHEALHELFRETDLGITQEPAVLVKVLPKIQQHHRQVLQCSHWTIWA